MRKLIFISILMGLILRPHLVYAVEGPEITPSCATLLAIVRAKTLATRPSFLKAKNTPLSASAGLPRGRGLLLGTYQQAQIFLAANRGTPIFGPAQIRDVERLRPDMFNDGQVFFMSELGLSAWTKVEFVPWRNLKLSWNSGFIRERRTQTRAQLRLRSLLETDGSIVGIDDELVSDFRFAYDMAEDVVEIIRDKAKRAAVIATQDPHGQLGLASMSLPDLFQALYEIERLRGLGNGPARPIEPNGHEGLRLRLPVILDDRSVLRFDSASARHLLQVMERYSLMSRLVRIDDEGQVVPLLHRRQLYFAAFFPELVPFLRETQPLAPDAPIHQVQDATLRNWLTPDVAMSIWSNFSAGSVHPFVFERIFLSLLRPELEALGLYKNIGFDLSLARNVDGEEAPAGLNVSIRVLAFDEDGKFITLSPDRLDQLALLVRGLLHGFKEFDGISVRIREDHRPRVPDVTPNVGPEYRLELEGADDFLKLQFMEILNEFSTYQGGRWSS